MTKKLYSIADVARLLEVQQYQVEYAHRTNKVPDVRQVAGKRIYDEADLRRVANHFGVDLNEVAE
ncbi:MAG: MerR family transcriptional regulator [Candidatus Nealsonbacteria bacterium]|nr:MerR family transcriptional regulator [Candidatus Nealsonbacteria bacterium]